MRTDDYKQSPYTPAAPDGEFGIACDSSLLVHTWREYKSWTAPMDSTGTTPVPATTTP